ncbi:glutaminase A [Prosthecobacter sp. SYSU 5D2]|uniref:glutaminase A n=1 Tax=Prosthecobacter sp. SYSU 5D2 TaxID=3134134 RepID=UPI0031FE70E8
MLSPIQEYLQVLHARYASVMDGHLADYIPELAKADPRLFGICIATRDGHVYEVGDTRHSFTIQSVSKALAYGLALQDRGEKHILSRIGVEPSGEAFNAISLKEGSGVPFNPMINAGAIATCGQVLPEDGKSRIDRILDYLSAFAGRQLDIDESIYRSESETGHRNRAIGWLLRNFGILDEDPHEILETYFKQCSIRVTCRDLALMGATLANQGVQPVTRKRVIPAEYVDNVLGVMATCGMYDWSGEWVYRVGLPAKSGVGGGILAVLPGQLGIGVFSPPLDTQGNSLRGIKVCMDLSQELALHMLNPAATPRTAVRQAYHGGEVVARRRLPPAARESLRRHGSRIQILALQGGLIFTTLEPVLRKAQQLADAGCLQLILDLRAVVSVDAVSLRLIGELRSQLIKQGVRMVICHPGKFEARLPDAGFTPSMLFATEDAALEACEDALLLEVTGASWRPAGNIPLEQCALFRSCTAEDLELMRTELTRRRYEAGQALITAGEMADEMLVLLEGSVEVQIRTENQNRKRVDVLTAGMTVGEMAFLDASPRSADVIALGFVNCLVIPRAWFAALNETRPALKISLLYEITREISARLRQANVEVSALQRE